MSRPRPDRRRILLLTEGRTTPLSAKTATGVIRYGRGRVVGLIDSTRAGQTAGALLDVGGDIPVCGSLSQAPEADTLIIGIAPAGGTLTSGMRGVIREAIGRGMHVESGMHYFLSDDEQFVRLAKLSGATLTDLRKNTERDVARFEAFDPGCLRLHTVGNDSCVGKMLVSVELARGLAMAGCDTKFVATGQTGMLIEGDGCAVDSVVSDFVGGATERLVLAAQDHEAMVVEGQGSLANPRYSGVTMGLLHGCLPDGLVLCYEAGRTEIVVRSPFSMSSWSSNRLRRRFSRRPICTIRAASSAWRSTAGYCLTMPTCAKRSRCRNDSICRLGTWCARASTALSARR